MTHFVDKQRVCQQQQQGYRLPYSAIQKTRHLSWAVKAKLPLKNATRGNLLANSTWQICRAKTADRQKRQKQQHGDKTHLSSKQANRQDDHYLSGISICDYRGAGLALSLSFSFGSRRGCGWARGWSSKLAWIVGVSDRRLQGGVVATWAHKAGKCQNDALCCLSYIPQDRQKEIGGLWAGPNAISIQMWTRQRARRQNESSSSARKRHLDLDLDWDLRSELRAQSYELWKGPTSLATKEPSRLFTCWKMPRLLWLTVRRNLAYAFCIWNASSERRRLLINSSAGRYKFVWLIATGQWE